MSCGTPLAAAIDRNPWPRAARASMSPITAVPSHRRASTHAGSSTCVTPHEPHRARRGRTPTATRPAVNTRRKTAWPHPPSLPPQPGHESRPLRRSSSATAVLLPTVSNGASKHLTALPGLREKVTGRADPKPTHSRCRRTPPSRNQNHHEKHAHQQRRNQANDAHAEWRLTNRYSSPAATRWPRLCPSCAERARALRAAQCREGWHLKDEPVTDPHPATEEQRWWIQTRAEAQALRDQAASNGQDTSDLDELVTDLDDEITAAGMRGNVLPARPARRHRSTKRRQDAPDLPRRTVTSRTVGKTHTAPDGKTFRPSMFLTLTCPSYGRVRDDGTPAGPGSSDHARAARDALHFAALFDRFIQNLRRFLGYDVQYFAAVEPQRRLAPHIHIAIRGTVSRAELRRVLAATYHQVWWPDTTDVRFDGDERPVWDEHGCTYVDPYTGEVLPTWDQALDAIGDQDEPVHVARFGDRFDAQGVLSGSKDAARCIGYLTKYLTKQVADCHQAQTDAEREHAERLAEALRFEPCSPGAPTGSGTASSPRTPGPA